MSQNGNGFRDGAVGLLFLGIAGFLLVYIIDSRILAAEVVIAISFGANLLAIAIPSIHLQSRRISHWTGALLFGALVAALLA